MKDPIRWLNIEIPTDEHEKALWEQGCDLLGITDPRDREVFALCGFYEITLYQDANSGSFEKTMEELIELSAQADAIASKMKTINLTTKWALLCPEDEHGYELWEKAGGLALLDIYKSVYIREEDDIFHIMKHSQLGSLKNYFTVSILESFAEFCRFRNRQMESNAKTNIGKHSAVAARNGTSTRQLFVQCKKALSGRGRDCSEIGKLARIIFELVMEKPPAARWAERERKEFTQTLPTIG
jgi:hypothetical protein